MSKIGKDNWACYDCKKAEFDGYLSFAIIGGQGAISNLNYIY